jgi:hypothetical protein
MVSDQSDEQPWRYRFVLAPAMIACVVLAVASIYYYVQGSCDNVPCMDHMPLLKGITLTLVFLGLSAKAVERIFIRRRRSGHST